jgi:hypothetical protein
MKFDFDSIKETYQKGYYRNESSFDRFIRANIAILFIGFAYFWIGSVYSILGYVIGFYFALTALIGFCPTYHFLGHTSWIGPIEESRKKDNYKWALWTIAWLIIVLVLSPMITKAILVSETQEINNNYKRLMFSASQDKRDESIRNYNVLTTKLDDFTYKYEKYRPYALKGYKEFWPTITSIKATVLSVDQKIQYGNLSSAYVDLEKVRPMFNIMLRNAGLSKEKLILADFQDAMDLLIASSEAKDIEGIREYYHIANVKLKDIEEIYSNDADVLLMRQQLESLYSLAGKGDIDKLPTKAQELKSSYTRIYLRYG